MGKKKKWGDSKKKKNGWIFPKNTIPINLSLGHLKHQPLRLVDERFCPGVSLHCDCSSSFSLEGGWLPGSQGIRGRSKQPFMLYCRVTHSPPLPSAHTQLYVQSESQHHLGPTETSHWSCSVHGASLPLCSEGPVLWCHPGSWHWTRCHELEVEIQL